ncbi:sporulation membrane protein YtaF [Paenibacillus radicis (ex Xue et al. 2023)]|uniref:Sporulation membrane protein YtaF n=1 Tax=Paenibacillus radicis (ex Xue et al. 2023) TaxID=2972489 RepID=A0ABT1YH97_9BACL|nr:sporulation membrane protein YtaF [Paenibacillus radicis (ex Xue et al. 2023)]MCR8631784.1 sporulation membrane protein YtaF [Paenibacillus radicis (ex Xue et al. 2023)]
MAWFLILGFAVSSSLDNLGVGISYGIREIRIRFLSNLVMAIICFLFSEIGILGGQWLSNVLPGIFPVLVGAFLLFIIGIRIILLAVPRKKKIPLTNDLGRSESKSLKGILQNPETADSDKSGEIGIGEALILGVALSANAVTNGLGAGLLGLSPLAISLTAAIGSFITVWFGVAVGRKVAGIHIGSFNLGQFGTMLSGIILLLIACNSFFN